MKFKISKEVVKRIIGFAPVVVAGIVAVGQSLADQKTQQDLEQVKRDVDELKKK